MTAVLKEIKKGVRQRQKKDVKETVKRILFFACGISAAGASWRDINLSFLALVLADNIGAKTSKYIYLSGAVAAMAVRSITDRSFIPYFISLSVYIVLSYALKSSTLPLFSACFTLSAAKLVLSFFRSRQTAFLSVLVGPVSFFTAKIVGSGREIVQKNMRLADFADALSLLALLISVSLSLSGFDGRSISFGGAAALAVSWLYSQRLKPDFSLLALPAIIFSISDRTGFAMAAVIYFALWAAGCFMAEKMSVFIYPVCAAGALLANMVFISDINSFFPSASVCAALIIYFLRPRFYLPTSPAKSVYDRKDRRQLAANLTKLQNSLNFLANCAIDISKLSEKQENRQVLEDIVANEVCRKCEKNTLCWQEKYSFTRSQFSSYGQNMRWADRQEFDRGFYRQCPNTEKIKNSFSDNYRMLLTKKYIAQSQKNNQKLLQSAFLSIAATVGDIISQSKNSAMVNYTVTSAMDSFLSDMKIDHSYCLCTRDPGKMDFAGSDRLGPAELEKISSRLESVYGCAFSPPVRSMQGNQYVYTFCQKTFFDYETGIRSSRLKQVNGDNYLLFCNNNKLFVILCDGMGTGSAAAAHSRTAVAMLKSLLETGVELSSALNIVNLALNLKDSGENSVSADILTIDLFTGKAQMAKAGAGPSFKAGKNGVEQIYSDSLPLGVLKDVKSACFDFDIAEGEVLLMLSDGACVSGSRLENIYLAPCDKIAEFAIGESKMQDDKTAIAIKLKIQV